MSNQFYDYLSNKLMDFFNENPPRAGDRFLINFDNNNQVNQFLEVLKKEDVSEFTQQYEGYNEFKTFQINFGEVDLVVADSSVTSDFLVTLRNLVAKSEGDWKNKALLIVSEDVKDSINEGMKNLEDEGYPLNLNFIVSSLSDDIENSDLSKVDKEILEVYLKNNVRNDLYKTTLWDFEQVLSIITKGLIEEKDYNELDLFYDSELSDITLSESRKKRIKENNNLFLEIEHISTFSDYEKKLSKQFDKKGINALKNLNEWRNADFSDLKKSRENAMDKTKSIKLEEINIDVDLPYWEKADSHTAAAQRKRNIVLFNTNRLDEIKLTFKFNKNLNRSFLNDRSKDTASISKNKLKINFPVKENETTFKRYIYEHENLSKNKFTFNVLVLNVDSKLLDDVKDDFKNVDAKGNIILNSNVDYLEFGEGPIIEKTITKENDEIIIDDGHRVSISLDDAEGNINNGDITFEIVKNWNAVPFKIKNRGNKPSPIKSDRIWNKKLESKTGFTFDGTLLYHNDERHTISKDLKEIFGIEDKIISNNLLNGEINYNSIVENNLDLSEELKLAYDKLFKYYQKIGSIPSLTYLDDNLKKIYSEIIDIVNKEIEEISDNYILSNNPHKANLNKIGVFKNGEKYFYSPIAPLNIAYQLAIANNYNDINSAISKKLNPNNLLPYVYDENNNVMAPSQHEFSKEWVVYEDVKNVSIGSTNLYLKKIVEEKLKQFVTNFKYLFSQNSKAPLKINVINVENDKEIVKGVFNFIKERINGDIIPIEVNIYNKNSSTYFDDLFKCTSSDDLEEKFDIKVKSDTLDSLDVIRLVQDNINYYVNKGKDEEDYGYAHISFYKQQIDSNYSNLDMHQIETGLYLNGLLSSCSSCALENDYRVGFGIKYSNPNDFLVRLAYNLNELAFNNQNKGSNPYSNDKTIVSLSKVNDDILDKIYNKSHWVTFIEPNFDLDFFSNQKNLFVIHYSDKYSSSALYDTVTVSNKSDQYKLIINDFLKEYLDDFEADDDVTDMIIKLFNSINGEWLLNLGLKEHGEREKISIVSAIKYALTILENEDIIWVPISVEEILRMAKNMGLNESGGLFTVSNWIGKREDGYSDDLLLMGLNTKNLELYYYPIKIKIGNNSSDYLEDAKKQINETYKSIMDYLTSDSSFVKKFYRNFFIQLFLTNQQRLINNRIWPNKGFDSINEFKKELINDDYVISDRLVDKIGVGAVLSFNDENSSDSINVDENVSIVKLPKYKGYTGIIEPISAIEKDIRSENSNIETDKLLAISNINDIGVNTLGDYKYSKKVDDESEGVIVVTGSVSEDSDDVDNSSEIVDVPEVVVTGYESDDLKGKHSPSVEVVEVSNLGAEDSDDIFDVGGDIDDNGNYEESSTDLNVTGEKVSSSGDVISLENVRALIGNEIEMPDNEVYWEFGNPDLANRHMLIQGKSGQGKSYFIQKMIQELSFQNIPTIVIDYTNSFKKQELDSNFKESLNSKLEYYYVLKEKLPLNPFKKYEIEIDEDLFIKQENEDVAGRFKSIISDIYGLGDQQANVIYKGIVKGLSEYGEENFDLTALKYILERNNSSTAATATSRLAELFDRNPFNASGNFDWSILDKKDGKVLVIQLAGLSKELQRVVSEIILWDLWHYKTVNGTKDKPFAVVLDECQNLDFADGSPCSKILTEGRKFGWSGLFATQSIKGSFNSEEISKLENVDEKIYFHPTDSSISDIAKTLAKTSNREKNQWEVILSSLTRGNCIVNGATLNSLNDLRYRAIPVKVGEIEKKSIMDDFNGDGNHPGHDDVNMDSYGDKSSSDSQFGEGASANAPEDNPKINCSVEKEKSINESAVNIEIVNRAGKFNLRYKDDNSVILGRFSSENTAELVKNILVEHGEDINYFESNNIFENNGGYYIFILNDGKISHLGFASSREEAERKLKLKSNKNNIPDKTEEDFIFKSGDKYLIIKDNKTFGEFMSMDYARVVKKFLTIYNWNVEKTNELGNIFGFNDKYFILEPNDDKIDILGVFDSYGEASQELSKGNDKQRKVSKYGTNIYKGKTGFFRISKSIKGDNVNFGHFKDLKIAQFVRKILDHNDWDVDYFIENNIFKFDNEYLVFKLNRSLVKLMGVFDSLEEAKKFVDNFDDDSVMDHAVKFVYKIRGKFAVQRNLDDGTFQAKFNTLEAAISFRDYLESVDWNIDLLQDLNNILQVGDKFLVFVVNNLRGYPLGEFNSKEEALANKERLIDDFKRGIVDNKKYKTDKHIHKSNRGYSVVKRIDGILTSFGTFNTREEAIAVRDELIANNWNLDYSHENSEDSLNSDVLNEIIFRLDPWEKIVFDAINELNSDKFTFDDLKQFENKFKRFTTPDKMESKVLKNLNSLTQQGLLVKTGENSYQKLWNY